MASLRYRIMTSVMRDRNNCGKMPTWSPTEILFMASRSEKEGRGSESANRDTCDSKIWPADLVRRAYIVAMS